MRNKILCILSILLLTVLLFPAAAFAAEEGNPGNQSLTGNNDPAATTAEEGDPEDLPLSDDYDTADDYIIGPAGERIPVKEETTAADTLSEIGENGYRAIVEDNADLFTDSEEAKLLSQLKELTKYGNMGILTNTSYNSDAASYARSQYISMFGETNGALFLIDMYNRRLQIFSGEDVFKTLSTAKTNEITDLVYKYASDGDYYKTAEETIRLMGISLDGGRVVAPMRYATNALFALGLVLIINFIIIMIQRKRSTKMNVMMNALVYNSKAARSSAVQSVRTVMTKQTKRKHVESTGGGGFSGGGGGFSGGGGGGFSGGGGGHSF